MAFYDNSHQINERAIERCAIYLVFSRYCIRDKGLKAIGTDLLNKHFEKNATNQSMNHNATNQALAQSAFLKKHQHGRLSFCHSAVARAITQNSFRPKPF